MKGVLTSAVLKHITIRPLVGTGIPVANGYGYSQSKNKEKTERKNPYSPLP
jgi:hypothetical protein